MIFRAVLKAVQTFYKPDITQDDIGEFLTAHELENELAGIDPSR
ncbi:MAG: hypothetical protein WDM78_00595 [Puia sp.]